MTLRSVAVALALITVPAGSAGQTAGQSNPPVVTNPDWISRPTGQDLARYFPPGAIQAGVGGRVVMACVVAVNGFLTRCHIISEDPPGIGFGPATLALAPLFQMRPRTVDGVSQEGAGVHIPVVWATGSGGRATAYERRRAERAQQFARTDTATPRNPQSALIVRPPWLAAPTAAEVAAVRVADGNVTMRCSVQTDGWLHQCRALAERPTGTGLGSAAEQLGVRFRLDLAAVEGAAGSMAEVDVPVAFTPTRPEYVARPTFAAVPTGGEIEAVLRAIAEPASERTARAALDCMAGEEGALTDCRVTSAEPAEAGPALLSLASRFRVRPWSEDGYSTAGARVRLPLRYVAD